ncbi:Ig-like domain-containing protein [Clostridium sporogenes]|uniref:Ig-like domain-containing protein n=1 Tax=Clostridium sporogenes TaxID=1509 RepID=UPI0022388872|nr:Ig-like domain-containing protein [Clostridium sporogenes]MCW6059673.1 Ig-like domain-containing protein [Clostridium sporogenes]MCW6069177.1 Ig-like domain-containing protein [Clostridium sporogenes]
MKKIFKTILVLIFAFIFIILNFNGAKIAKAVGFNDVVVGTQNLNNSEENSAKLGNSIRMPEKGWKRYDNMHDYIEEYDKYGNIKKRAGDTHGDKYYFGTNSTLVTDPNESQGSFMRLKFKGTKFRIITYSGRDMGESVKVTIDGKEVNYFNSSANFLNPNSSYISYALAYEKLGLEDKEHIVQIEMNPDYKKEKIRYVYIDAIDIDETGKLKSLKEVKSESISLNKTSMDLLEGSSDKLNAKVLPEDATNKKVVWSSSDEKIATVDKDGKVTGIKEGKATITAKVEGTDLTATCKVNVTKKVEENKNNAILSISLVNGATKEYDVSMQEVEKFINWFEERSNGKGSSLYSFNKKINPYKTVKEYIVHDKIASFEVREYEGQINS